MITYISGSDRVALTLVPRTSMTWKMWFEALSNFVSFILDLDRECQFLVLEEGYEGEVGYGILTLNSRSETS